MALLDWCGRHMRGLLMAALVLTVLDALLFIAPVWVSVGLLLGALLGVLIASLVSL